MCASHAARSYGRPVGNAAPKARGNKPPLILVRLAYRDHLLICELDLPSLVGVRESFAHDWRRPSIINQDLAPRAGSKDI